jgi:RNA polymerase sigma-70 factor (ECF subfamily)
LLKRDVADAMMGPLTPESLGRLIDAHAAALELYAAQWTQSPGDVVQETFLQLFRQERLPEATVAWLYRVTRNRAINAARASRWRRHHEAAVADGRRGWFESSDVGELEADEAAQQLGQLPGQQREVIVARLWGGLSFEQIGEVTGTSSSTACRRYQQGIEALRKRLTASWPSTMENPEG